jgi:hypothetical protein
MYPSGFIQHAGKSTIEFDVFLTSNQFLGHFPAMFDMFDEARGIQRPIFSAMG